MNNISREEVEVLRRKLTADAAVGAVRIDAQLQPLQNGNSQGLDYTNGGYVDGEFVGEWTAGSPVYSAPC